MRLFILSLPFIFNFSYLCSMDICKADKPFSIISNNHQIIEVPYEYAVQLKALHPLSARVPFKSQHKSEDITLLLQSFKATKQKKVDEFLKDMVGNAPRINIESEITLLSQSGKNESKENVFFKHFAQLESLKKMGRISILMSVACDLQATDFAMLCVPYIIDAPSQNRLFSVLVPLKRQLKFEELIGRYIVAQSKKIEIDEIEFHIQNNPRADASHRSNKIIKIINNQIQVYNEQNELLLRLSDGNFKGEVTRIIFSKDRKHIVGIRWNPRALHERNAFCMWNAENGQLLVEFPLVHEAIFVGLNADGTLAGVILKYIGSHGTYDWEIVAIDVTNHARPKIINQISSYRVESLYFSEDNSIAFYEGFPHEVVHCRWDLNAGKKLIAELNFAQKIFLYQLYEYAESKQSSVSLMIGFVKDSVKKSLPVLLQDWAFSRTYNIRSHHEGKDTCHIA